MAINDDECDFDTLSALLENDEALESRKPLGISIENTSGNNDDDDDDDISDSELDRLINEVDNNVACDNKSGEISSTQNELSDSNINKLGQAANTFCNVKDALLLEEMQQLKERLFLLESQLQQRNVSTISSLCDSNLQCGANFQTSALLSQNSSLQSSVSQRGTKVTSVILPANDKIVCSQKNSDSLSEKNTLEETKTVKQRHDVRNSEAFAKSDVLIDHKRKSSDPSTQSKEAVSEKGSKIKTNKAISPNVCSKTTNAIVPKEVDIFASASTSNVGTRSFNNKPELSALRHDSDSDWDPLDGEDRCGLTEQGREIKVLIENRQNSSLNKEDKPKESARVAHTTNINTAELEEKKKRLKRTQLESESRQAKRQRLNKMPPVVGPGIETSYVTTCNEQQQQADQGSIALFGGLRVIKPLISSATFKSHMESKILIPLSRLQQKRNSAELDNDWVVVGVVISKSEPKISSKGNHFSIWKLSDLVNECESTVTLMLFGDVHKTLWKCNVGTTIGILNAEIMKPSEKAYNPNELTITVQKFQQVMIFGQSRDLGYCQGQTKNGNHCGKAINLQKGNFCIYHVKRAYNKFSARRPDLQGGGPVPGSKLEMHRKGFEADTGGRLHRYQRTDKKRLSLGILTEYQSTKGMNKVSTLHLNDIPHAKPIPGSTQTNSNVTNTNYPAKFTDNANEKFYEAVCTPSAGSMNLVKSLKIQEKTISRGSGKNNQQANKKADLKFADIFKAEESTESNNTSIKTSSSAGVNRKLSSSSLVANSQTKVINSSQTFSKTNETVKISPHAGGGSSGSNKPLSNSPQLGRGIIPGPTISPQLGRGIIPGPTISPQLGRGIIPGQTISLDFDIFAPEHSIKRMSAVESSAIAKRKAAAKLKEKGIEKVDPNAVRKKLHSQEIIERRRSKQSIDSAQSSNKVKKKNDLLSGLDLNSPEVQKMLKMRSINDGIVSKLESEQQEEYFSLLEQKERLEDKMAEIRQMKVKVVSCKQCDYTAESAAQRCRDENHVLVKSEGVRRYFECKECKQRTTSLDRLPKMDCSRCGARNFVRCSMFKEKKGPQTAKEEFEKNLRGEEKPFIGSLK